MFHLYVTPYQFRTKRKIRRACALTICCATPPHSFNEQGNKAGCQMNKRSIYMTQNRPRFESGGFQLFGRIGTATALRGVVYFNSTGRKRKYETKSDPLLCNWEPYIIYFNKIPTHVRPICLKKILALDKMTILVYKYSVKSYDGEHCAARTRQKASGGWWKPGSAAARQITLELRAQRHRVNVRAQ